MREGCDLPRCEKNFDRLDYEIIQALHADARVTASEISRAAHSNERTIRKRIERLLKRGATGLSAILDPQAFGDITAADAFLQIDPAQEEKITSALMDMPEVTCVAYRQARVTSPLRHVSRITRRFKNSLGTRCRACGGDCHALCSCPAHPAEH